MSDDNVEAVDHEDPTGVNLDDDQVEVNAAPADEKAIPDEEAKPLPEDDPVPPPQLSDDEVQDMLDDVPPEVQARLIDSYIPSDTVEMDDLPFHPTKREARPEGSLGLLLQGAEDMVELTDSLGIDFREGAPPMAPRLERVKTLIGQLTNTLQTLYFRETMKRTDAKWRQYVETDNGKLRAGKAKLSADADPVLRMRNEMGLGGLVQIPLYHSGIWITYKTPSDAELLELEQTIALDKAAMGRQSNGMVFSNTEVYATSHIVDFALKYIYASTLPNSSAELHKEMILCTDIPQLIWGLLLAIWPQGYPLLQPCVANPETCDHVISQLINLSKISWTDNNRLSEQQKNFMKQRKDPQTVDRVRDYQSQFVFKAQGEVKIHDKASLRIRVPSIKQAQDSGFAWVDDIANATQKAFSMKMGQNQRDEYIQSQALITSLRQYSHWCHAVVSYDKDGNEIVYDEPQVVDDLMKMISEDDALVEKTLKAILTYIDACSITVIAIPKWKCPKCQGEVDEKYLKHPRLVPLDVVNVFFTLRVQKVTAKLTAEQRRYL